MWTRLRLRLDFARDIYWRRVTLLPLLVTTVGVYDLAAGQLPTKWQDATPHLGDVVGHGWLIWLVVALSLMVLIGIEGGFRRLRAAEAAIAVAPGRPPRKESADLLHAGVLWHDARPDHMGNPWPEPYCPLHNSELLFAEWDDNGPGSEEATDDKFLWATENEEEPHSGTLWCSRGPGHRVIADRQGPIRSLRLEAQAEMKGTLLSR